MKLSKLLNRVLASLGSSTAKARLWDELVCPYCGSTNVALLGQHAKVWYLEYKCNDCGTSGIGLRCGPIERF